MTGVSRIILASIFLVALFSCEEEVKEETVVKVSFEEVVRAHTIEYCNCAPELNAFIDSTKGKDLDQATYQKYERLQQEFQTCFDPNGEKKTFRGTLSGEKRAKQKELFAKYRQEICPDILPE